MAPAIAIKLGLSWSLLSLFFSLLHYLLGALILNCYGLMSTVILYNVIPESVTVCSLGTGNHFLIPEHCMS